MKNIVLLGSTGSVGRNVLDVIAGNRDDFNILALASRGRNVRLLSEQARRFKPKIVCISEKDSYKELRSCMPKGTSLVAGEEETGRIAALEEADVVFLAISGIAGLAPLAAALRKGKTVALASKEPVVSAGRIISKMRDEHSATMIPVDSEHSALSDCLAGLPPEAIRKVFITGSGGSLWERRGMPLDDPSVEEVLAHPRWDMGPKITVDSATLMNKALEMIEAKWLFDLEMNRIDVVIHPEAVIHALVELSDGTVRACCFIPDMRYPVRRALYWPDIPVSQAPGIDLAGIGRLSFHELDRNHFPAMDIAMSAVEEDGTKPAVLNAANDEAVRMFLSGELRFKDIIATVEQVLGRHRNVKEPGLADIMEAEVWAKEEVGRLC